MKKISLIIPLYINLNNLGTQIVRINRLMKENGFIYEILFLCSAHTYAIAAKNKKYTKKYPIQFIQTVAPLGTIGSITEGLKHVSFSVIALYGNVLSVTPEDVPALYKKLVHNDIVVGSRGVRDSSNYAKSILERVVGYLIQKILGVHQDVFSGIVMCKKEIVSRVPKHAAGTGNMVLQLLIFSRHAGYKIAEYSLRSFRYDRKNNARKKIISFLKNLMDIFAIKFQESPVIRFTNTKKNIGFHFKGNKFFSYTALPYEESAFSQLNKKQILWLIGMLVFLVLWFLFNWHLTLLVIISIISVIYFADLLFNCLLIYRSFTKSPEVKINKQQLAKLHDKTLPKFTIFCPLYNEWQVVPQFIAAMKKMEYPKQKLQIMLLLEKNDKKTIANINKIVLPSNFSKVIIPHSQPKTKPKACNYGLQFATGDYVVIFDAEDIPDPLQLKKVVVAFKNADPRTVCFQAKLNFYNPHQNILTRLFTAEYSLWFDLVLTGLQSIQAPIPLGGTSNHFKTAVLRELNGWDPFNVTEDCDLGMRLVKKGYKTQIVDSETLEEANSNFPNWILQRSRWIKGYMQTYFVHMRSPKSFLTNWKEPHFFTFQLIVGGKILSMCINPLLWVITLSYFMFRAKIGLFIQSFYISPIYYIAVFSLVFGNFLYMYYYIIGCLKRGYDDLILYTFFVPFYWLAMSFASWIAFYQVIVKPHYWSKTKHGLHLSSAKHHHHSFINMKKIRKSLFPKPFIKPIYAG